MENEFEHLLAAQSIALSCKLYIPVWGNKETATLTKRPRGWEVSKPLKSKRQFKTNLSFTSVFPPFHICRVSSGIKEYFAESINSNAGFYGIQCESYFSYVFGWCDPKQKVRSKARLNRVRMGEHCEQR